MLPKIKRSIFKLITDQEDELSLRKSYDGKPSIELSKDSGCLWIFRYDCIVSVQYPQFALTVQPDGCIELDTFVCDQH
jgi:hypothetical protein